ncbi:MAG: YHS domain-containing protein [Fimbriiglobus sp.]|jgi:YHS domain-containing protein|nr:YHS domain-containing protein [Fimbriiglobus sp.]
MKVRTLLAALLGSCLLPLVFAADEKKDKLTDKEVAAAKEELTKLGEFVGPWTVNAEDGAKKPLGKEKWDWSWKFGKDGAPSLAAKVSDSKFFSEAVVTYDAKAKGYKVTVKDAKGTEQGYTGNVDRKGIFILSRTDAKTGDVHTLKLGTAAEGVRLNVSYEVQTGGKGLASTSYKASGNKDGESIAGGGKKPECIVTGGAASIKVSYNGKDYFVCCSGCADEFKANPEKYTKKK